MEPTLPTPIQPESAPARSPEGQQAGEQYVKPENPSAGFAEKVGEMRPVATPQVPPIQTQATMQPIGPPPAATPSQQVPQPAGIPLIADDVDVIEKEWVDKAKKIVSATREDPHMQEQQVSALQADYLMKRYNKKIKLAE